MKNFNCFFKNEKENVKVRELVFLSDSSIGKRDFAFALRKMREMGPLLSGGAYIGWQLRLDGEGKTQLMFFANRDSGITDGDIDWIFDRIAKVNTETEVGICNAPNRRKNYTIRTRQTSENLQGSFCDRWEEDLNQMLMQSNVILQMTVYKGEQDETDINVLLSLTGEMPMRMKTLLTLAFPHSLAERTTGLISLSELTGIDAASVSAGMPEVIDNLYSELKRRTCPLSKAADTDDLEFIDDEDDDSTPLDILNLSIRSYNCLMRAGVRTVEKLRAMTDEELKKVRNLGRKSYEEIKKALGESCEDVETESSEDDGVDYYEQLDEMIGLEEIKTQVRKIAALVRMKKAMESSGDRKLPITLNMQFVGNPGTAKTSVAHILAGIFYREGLVKSSNAIVVGRSDLVGEYVGHTAARVQRLFEKAKGRLLFIDEAYALADTNKGSFGDEAINTIVQEVEANRGDTIVIFAGYKKEMGELFSKNPGLKSRVPFTIEFKDYTVEEMAKIVELQAKNLGFSVSPEALEKVKDICLEASKKPDFGNGRFCRNRVEDAVLSYAYRLFLNGKTDIADVDFTLSADDFSYTPEVEVKERKPRSVIGF